jgi:hypothetical protein
MSQQAKAKNRLDAVNKEVKHKKPLKDGRLLFLSPFDENQRRISAKSSHYRNLRTLDSVSR